MAVLANYSNYSMQLGECRSQQNSTLAHVLSADVFQAVVNSLLQVNLCDDFVRSAECDNLIHSCGSAGERHTKHHRRTVGRVLVL